jgi:thioredoxin-like negative regulator of GroEL
MGVVKIELDNYKQGLQRMKGVTGVVLVFHPQCGHCIQMRPNWEAMKSMVHPNVKIVEINGEAMHSSPEMSASPVGQNTEGFPSLMRLHNGKVVAKFNDERTPEKMAAFVNQASPMKRKGSKFKKSKKAKGKTKKLRRKN